MKRIVIITSKYYKSVCSVVIGTPEQITALLKYDPVAHGFKVHTPSDFDYCGEVLSLDTLTCNACQDILQGKAKLPKDLHWLV